MTLIYLAHDLTDAAIRKRLQMLRSAGETPVLMGFRRSADPLEHVDGWPAIDLGRTEDARLLRRAGSVLAAALALGRWRAVIAGATVILARNLEMLLLAHVLRARFAPDAKIVFECLDIHAQLSGPGAKGRLMRGLERRLLRGCAGLVVSSPAFLEAHFNHLGVPLPPVFLLENRLLQAEMPAVPAALAMAPPWRIGWFGVIRCRHSLDLLAGLVRAGRGRIEVDIRGRVAGTAIADFDAVVGATPGLVFHGPYDRSRDLAEIYGAVHFTWAMDFYEAGANSSWLLPNRLYEGGAMRRVPIAQGGVQTGDWLQRCGVGVVLQDPIAPALEAFFGGLTAAGHQSLTGAMAALPAANFIMDDVAVAGFAAWLSAPVRSKEARPSDQTA